MKYKIGDRVRIVNNWNKDVEYSTRENEDGDMDEYLGTVMTIVDAKVNSRGIKAYCMKEDNGRWFWFEHMIKCKEENKLFGKSDLVNGDILIMRNDERYIVMKNYGGADCDTWISMKGCGWCDPNSFSENLIVDGWGANATYDIVKVMRPTARYVNPYNYMEKEYDVVFDRNAERKKMTIENIERELGYKIAVVDKEGK